MLQGGEEDLEGLLSPLGRHIFQSEAKACPAKGTCRWKQRSYLIQADTVLAGPEQNGFRCAHYVTAKGKPMAGFLPSANLEPAKAPKTLDLLRNQHLQALVRRLSCVIRGEGRLGISAHVHSHGLVRPVITQLQ